MWHFWDESAKYQLAALDIVENCVEKLASSP